MAWVQIGNELPIQDEAGERPFFDKDGIPREKEFVANETWQHVEFDIDDMATNADRRWFEHVRYNMFQQRPSSVQMAGDFEDVFHKLVAKFVRGVRDKDSQKEKPGVDGKQWIIDNFEWDDVFLLVGTIAKQVELEKTKKKNSKSLFG